MNLATVLATIILPAFGQLLPGQFGGREAAVMMLAIGLQESRFEHRRQMAGGPARGFWQFERAGVRGVLYHPSTRRHALAVCMLREVGGHSEEVLERLEHDDLLAAAFARLLLWTDPAPLPQLGAVEDAWVYYTRNWRPGKPHPATWPALYHRAIEATAAMRIAA